MPKKIISTPGIDAIMIGPADLSHDMGISGQLHHPRIEEAFREIINQCNKYGVAPGIHLSDMEDVKKMGERRDAFYYLWLRYQIHQRRLSRGTGKSSWYLE